jgi:hypothetical protein
LSYYSTAKQLPQWAIATQPEAVCHPLLRAFSHILNVDVRAAQSQGLFRGGQPYNVNDQRETVFAIDVPASSLIWQVLASAKGMTRTLSPATFHILDLHRCLSGK